MNQRSDNQVESESEMPSSLTPPEPMGGGNAREGGFFHQQPQPQPQTQNHSSAKPSEIPTINSPMPHHQTEHLKPPKSVGTIFMMLGLFVVLVVAVLVFLSWKGWINFFGIGQNKEGYKPNEFELVTASPTPEESSTPIEEESPSASPSPTPEETSSATPTATNDEQRKNDLSKIKNALKNYYVDNLKYPESAEIVKTSDNDSPLAEALEPKYIVSLPDDPMTPKFYYGYKSDGQSFQITCVLEDKTDISGTIQGGFNIYKVTDSSFE